MKRRALIIGAGIAGPIAAAGLLQSGFEPVVFETYPRESANGAGSWLSVAVNGLEAMRTVDLHRGVLAASFPSTTIELCNGSGQRLGVVALGGVLADGTATQTIRRADLYRALADEAERRGVRFEYGRRLVAAEQASGGSVVARFEGGAAVEADLLIGADGVHSALRKRIDPHAPSPRVTGMGNVGGFVPAGVVAALTGGAASVGAARGAALTGSAAFDLAQGSYRMIFGERAFFGFVVHPTGDVWWFANPPVPYPAAPDLEWLASLFDADAGPAAALIRATPGPLVFAMQYELPRVPHWQRGSMVLLGDAAHAASPTSGQGASLAAEDAVALARCLRDLPIPDALATFESTRRRRAERVVREAARMSAHKVPGALGRFVRDLVLPRLLSRATRDSRDWLFGYRIPWDNRALVGEPAAAH